MYHSTLELKADIHTQGQTITSKSLAKSQYTLASQVDPYTSQQT